MNERKKLREREQERKLKERLCERKNTIHKYWIEEVRKKKRKKEKHNRQAKKLKEKNWDPLDTCDANPDRIFLYFKRFTRLMRETTNKHTN